MHTIHISCFICTMKHVSLQERNLTVHMRSAGMVLLIKPIPVYMCMYMAHGRVVGGAIVCGCAVPY